MNETLLIFGSNSVILREFIKYSLKNKFNVVGISKSNDKFFKNYKNFYFIKHDVLKGDNDRLIKKINKKFKISSIIYAIGGSLNKKKIFEKKDVWKLVWEFNFGYTININNFFIKKFEKNKFGRILYFTSSITDNKFGSAVYSSSKKAIEDYVLKMGNNFAERNVYINAINTSIVSGLGNNWGKFELQNERSKQNKTLSNFISSKKFGRSEYFKKLIYLLVTKENYFITGSIIKADGGYRG